jgi:hypothetical protein
MCVLADPGRRSLHRPLERHNQASDPGQAAARELFATQGWVDGPPVIEHLEVVGSYHLFGTQPQELRR